MSLETFLTTAFGPAGHIDLAYTKGNDKIPSCTQGQIQEALRRFEESDEVPYEITSRAMRNAHSVMEKMAAIFGGWTYGASAVIDSVSRAILDGTVGELLIVNDSNVDSFPNGIQGGTVIACFDCMHHIQSITAKVLVLAAEDISVGEIHVSQALAIITNKLDVDSLLFNKGDVFAPELQCGLYAALDYRLFTLTPPPNQKTSSTPDMFDSNAASSLNMLLKVIAGLSNTAQKVYS